MSLHARKLHQDADGRALLTDVSLNARAGELHVLLGPNGAGKSTLLRLLSGELRTQRGTVECLGRPLDEWTPAALARQRAVLPQGESLRFAFTAEQVVNLGRLPCLHHSPAREREIVQAALHETGMQALAARKYPTLSGGERARVQLSRLLAQVWEPAARGEAVLLLDEPTAALDIAHQHHTLKLARSYARRGCTVVAILHDLNHALAYADRVSLLCCGELIASGTPAEVLTRETLERVYGVQVEIIESAGLRHIAVMQG